MKLFSIIVANYNNGRFLPQLIKSVQEQTYSNWELIVADDCSTDNSVEIITPYLADKRIKFVRHEKNKGAGATFRTAADNATGEWVGMLGADDALPADALEKMMNAHIQHPEASLINSDCYACDENLEIKGIYESFHAVAPGERLIDDTCVGNFASYKRSSYLKTEGFDASLRKAVDHDIFLKLDEVGSLHYLHEPLYLYRLHSGGISQNENGLRAAQTAILAKRNAYFRRRSTPENNLTASQYNNMMKTYYVREAFFYRHKDKKRANSLLKEGFINFPSVIFKKAFWSVLLRNNLTKG